ncbi:MAG TPA: acyclic terpene utilization AtuA family protein [Gemmataceae bacterium]|nr:acyclic terpene utilization AtuA family protein [Gemmataceae bacterium]
MKRVRIGNGCGFWGDNLDTPRELAEHGRLDYLTLEYLAELTMSILALQKQRHPEAGFAGDFLDVLQQLAPVLHRQPQLKIVTNAGGMNPHGCAGRARALLDQAELKQRRIAIVHGDDLLPRLDELLAQGHGFTNLDTGEPLSAIRDRIVSVNAYLGCQPIVTALRQGADIVITGRVADASLTLGPAVYEFGWQWDDWDRLTAGTAAGHLIECGAQATGGLWCSWQETDLALVGYPIADLEESGEFILTKPAGSGGAVNRETVAEQLLYEVGDPAAYLTPDVVADFTSVQLTEIGPDQVRITGARGKAATDRYKVSIAYRDGWTADGTLLIAGPEAAKKARRCGEMIFERLRRAGALPAHRNIECLGSGDSVPGVLPIVDAPEVVMRVTVRDADRAVVERFTKEFAPLVTSGPPGVTGYTTGRPTVREVFAYWPALVDKSVVVPRMQFLGSE